jgi:Fic family protein
MKRSELAAPLKAAYGKHRGFGAIKVPDAGYENIWFIVPPPPPRKLICDLPLRALAKARSVLARQPDFASLTSLDKLVSYYFVRREAVESSRLEGTWSTIDQLLTPSSVADSQGAPDGRQSVRGYAHAIEKHLARAAALKERVFTQETVRQIHKEIVAKDPRFRGVPGALRSPGKPGAIVQIGGSFRKEESTYNPAPPAFVASSLQAVLDWLSDDKLAQRGDAGIGGFTLPVRLALGHAHFEAVHPFPDGNGRVGRALWPLQMVCADHLPVYLSGFVEAYRGDYGRALQAAQKKLTYGEIIEFICEAIVRGQAEAAATRAAIEGMPALWIKRARFREGSAALRALDVLQRQPIVTIALLQGELKLTNEAARLALDQLIGRGIAHNRGRFGRELVFAAEEIIALLSRPFGSDVAQALKEGQRALRKNAKPSNSR